MNKVKTLVAAAAVTLAVPLASVAQESGAFKVPGTDTTLKFNGFAETALFYQFSGGSRFLYQGCDYYLCSVGIALDGEKTNNPQAAMTSAYTRFGVSSSTPSGVGVIGTRIEIDAAKAYMYQGQSDTHGDILRLRHGYGTIGDVFLMGQTWSTFADLNTFPDQMDENPLMNLAALRAPMIRAMFPISSAKLTLALEDPYLTSLTGNPAPERAFWNVPDFIARLDFGTGPASVSVRGVAKQYKTETASTAGYGVGLGLALKLGGDMLVVDASGGPGIGTYIYGSTLGPTPEDAMQINANTIKTWTVWGASAGFTHNFSPAVRGNLMASGIWTSSNSDIQAASAATYAVANKSVYTGAANLYWQPAKIFWLGVEAYYNYRENFASQHGSEWRGEFVGHFNLL